MNKLIIIEPNEDWNINIHILNVAESVDDSLIKNLGFNPSKCDWFVGNNVNIYKGC